MTTSSAQTTSLIPQAAAREPSSCDISTELSTEHPPSRRIDALLEELAKTPDKQFPDKLNELFDTFVHTNQRALSVIVELHQHLNSLVTETDSRSRNRLHNRVRTAELINTLSDTLDSFLQAAYVFTSDGTAITGPNGLFDQKRSLIESLCNSFERLEAGTRWNEHELPPFDAELFWTPTHIKNSFLETRSILSRSAPSQPTLETITTVEEFIRFTHAVGMRGLEYKLSLLRTYVRCKNGPLPHLTIDEFSYLGSKSEDQFRASPIGMTHSIIVSALHDKKLLTGARKLRFDSAMFSDRGFVGSAYLGHHYAFFSVIYDSCTDRYCVKFGLNEPAYGRGRINFCAKLFPLEGFSHSASGWSHEAVRYVSLKDLDRALRFIFFIPQYLGDLDIGGGHGFFPAEVAQQFDIAYSHDRVTHPLFCKEEICAFKEFLDRLDRRTGWTERQKDVLARLIHDPFPISRCEPLLFWMGGCGHELHFRPGVLRFMSRQEDLLESIGSISELMKLLEEATEIVFSCFTVQYSSSYDDTNTPHVAPSPFTSAENRAGIEFALNIQLRRNKAALSRSDGSSDCQKLLKLVVENDFWKDRL